MKLARTLLLYSLTLPFLCVSWSNAYAQASPFEMQLFPMPPDKGFAGEKHFRYAGDYYYPYTSDYATYRIDRGADEYSYFRYTGIFNKNINVLPALANVADIPPPRMDPRRGLVDSCGHVHLSYGIWVRYEGQVSIGSSRPINTYGYNFIGGGGMSGVRDTRGRCVFRTDNLHSNFSDRFGWGVEFTSFTPTYGTYDLNIYGSGFTIPVRGRATEMILGVTAPSHGWSAVCDDFQCYNPVRPYVWTLRPR